MQHLEIVQYPQKIAILAIFSYHSPTITPKPVIHFLATISLKKILRKKHTMTLHRGAEHEVNPNHMYRISG